MIEEILPLKLAILSYLVLTWQAHSHTLPLILCTWSNAGCSSSRLKFAIIIWFVNTPYEPSSHNRSYRSGVSCSHLVISLVVLNCPATNYGVTLHTFRLPSHSRNQTVLHIPTQVFLGIHHSFRYDSLSCFQASDQACTASIRSPISMCQ